jgi:hypothetical protein
MVLVGLVGLMKSDHYALLREIINSYTHKDPLLENAVDGSARVRHSSEKAKNRHFWKLESNMLGDLAPPPTTKLNQISFCRLENRR